MASIPGRCGAAHGTGAHAPDGRVGPRVREEEHFVVSPQRYEIIGFEDEYDKLRETFADRLPDVARRFAALTRPWLRIGT